MSLVYSRVDTTRREGGVSRGSARVGESESVGKTESEDEVRVRLERWTFTQSVFVRILLSDCHTGFVFFRQKGGVYSDTFKS